MEKAVSAADANRRFFPGYWTAYAKDKAILLPGMENQWRGLFQ